MALYVYVWKRLYINIKIQYVAESDIITLILTHENKQNWKKHCDIWSAVVHMSTITHNCAYYRSKLGSWKR